jgi:beta-N-acetylhexosaminidase
MAQNSPRGPLMVDVAGHELTAVDVHCLCHPLVGGVILFSRNFRDRLQLTELVAAIHELRSPHLLVSVDQEGGRVQRLIDGFTRLPSSRTLGRRFEENRQAGEEAAWALGYIMASELREVGIDFSFAPVVDLFNPASAVIGTRAFSDEAATVRKLADQVAIGMVQGGMIGVAKHFPGHGGVSEDSHTELPVDQRTIEQLRHADLSVYERLPFDIYGGVLVAHVAFPAIDRDVASFSPYWIQEQLRERLGFDGAVVCDDLMMGAAASVGSIDARVQLALDAGCDLVLVCNDRVAVNQVIETLEQAVWSPPLSDRLVRLTGGVTNQSIDVEPLQVLLTSLAEQNDGNV